jgi:branched-chain amino acid transport system permease protein
VVFKATDVFNFAQGMFVFCGAFFAVTAITLLGLPFPLAIAAILCACAALVVVVHVFLIQPLAEHPILPVIMLTIALAIVLRAIVEISYGPQGRTLVTPLPASIFLIGGVRISQLHLIAALVSWACMAEFFAFFRFTPVTVAQPGSVQCRVRSAIGRVHWKGRGKWSSTS